MHKNMAEMGKAPRMEAAANCPHRLEKASETNICIPTAKVSLS